MRAPHEELTVTARSVVETYPAAEPPDVLAWEALATPAVLDRFAELLAPTPRTALGEPALARAREASDGRLPAEAAAQVCRLVCDSLDYVPGATGVTTSAQEAWEVGKGVCQDMAHVAVGMLRALGVPARYVSGYLLPRSDLAVGDSVGGESHAWVEWWAGEWQAWDPTSGRRAGVDHVLVGRGRDYDDVPPLRGVYSGPGGGELFVTVEFTRLA